MRISFDVDDTLVCDATVPFEQPVPWWARAWFPERLRRGTRDLMHALQRRECRIWIYTTSHPDVGEEVGGEVHARQAALPGQQTRR